MGGHLMQDKHRHHEHGRGYHWSHVLGDSDTEGRQGKERR